MTIAHAVQCESEWCVDRELKSEREREERELDDESGRREREKSEKSSDLSIVDQNVVYHLTTILNG